MTQAGSRIYYSDSVQRSQVLTLDLWYKITAAKTVTSYNKNAAISSFDAVASQAVINDYLGTVDEFLVAAFDATAMGTDAFAVIANMGGQAAELVSAQASTYSGTDGLTVVAAGVMSVSALTASSHTAQAALGAYGNLAARFVLTGVDALTSGAIHVRLNYRIK